MSGCDSKCLILFQHHSNREVRWIGCGLTESAQYFVNSPRPQAMEGSVSCYGRVVVLPISSLGYAHWSDLVIAVIDPAETFILDNKLSALGVATIPVWEESAAIDGVVVNRPQHRGDDHKLSFG